MSGKCSGYAPPRTFVQFIVMNNMVFYNLSFGIEIIQLPTFDAWHPFWVFVELR